MYVVCSPDKGHSMIVLHVYTPVLYCVQCLLLSLPALPLTPQVYRFIRYPLDTLPVIFHLT